MRKKYDPFYTKYINEVNDRFDCIIKRLDKSIESFLTEKTFFDTENYEVLIKALKYLKEPSDPLDAHKPKLSWYKNRNMILALKLGIYERIEKGKSTHFSYIEYYSGDYVYSIISTDDALKDAFKSLGLNDEKNEITKCIKDFAKLVTPLPRHKNFWFDWREKIEINDVKFTKEDYGIIYNYSVSARIIFVVLGLAIMAYNLDEKKLVFRITKYHKFLMVNFVTSAKSLERIKDLLNACFYNAGIKDIQSTEIISIAKDTDFNNLKSKNRVVLIDYMNYSGTLANCFDSYNKYIEVNSRKVEYPFKNLFVVATDKKITSQNFLSYDIPELDESTWNSIFEVTRELFKISLRYLSLSVFKFDFDMNRIEYKNELSTYASLMQAMIVANCRLSLNEPSALYEKPDTINLDAQLLEDLNQYIYDSFYIYDDKLPLNNTHGEDEQKDNFDIIVDFLNKRLADGSIDNVKPKNKEDDSKIFIYKNQKEGLVLCFKENGIVPIIEETGITGYSAEDFISKCKTKYCGNPRGIAVNLGKSGGTDWFDFLHLVQENEIYRIKKS